MAEYWDLNWAEIKGFAGYPLIWDGRNFLDKEELEKLGIRY